MTSQSWLLQFQLSQDHPDKLNLPKTWLDTKSLFHKLLNLFITFRHSVVKRFRNATMTREVEGGMQSDDKDNVQWALTKFSAALVT